MGQEEIRIGENQQAQFRMRYDFPMNLYRTCLDEKPNRTNQWHWHEELQLLICESGKMRVTAEQWEYELQAGEGLFLNSGLLHSSKALGAGPVQYSSFNIDERMLTFFPGSVLTTDYVLPYLGTERMPAVPLRREVPWQEAVLAAAGRMRQFLQEKKRGYEMEAFLQLLRIWALLVENAGGTAAEQGNFHRQEIKKILRYLQQNYREPFRLEELASHLHRSAGSCCRVFKEALGCTIVEYLTGYRIEKSLSLLRNPDLSVTETGYAVGFTDASYFIRKFREIMGCTPRQYRNMQSSGRESERFEK